MSQFYNDFDGVKNRSIFCMWTGKNPMSANRIQALWSIYNNVGCPVIFVTNNNLRNWIHPDFPLHDGFEFLSETHKSDYLRCYFMHHYGGGYTDIKQTTRSWGIFFDKLNDSEALALGYEELEYGIPHINTELGDEIRKNYRDVIGLCAFIFKKNSSITSEWYSSTIDFLDSKLGDLKDNPARHPQDQKSMLFDNGDISQYPLEWAELLGEIFHPIIYRNRGLLIKGEIAPIFSGYR
jgi:hypothetical protein